ncbi:unnamed protein product [Zymoseptoria tritici ST99CH_3D1]|uniref:PNPLA domain-containing protein n=2 Tax=Zymoseptoria tritici TaxID=1047171 RepID=A0A1X7RWF5_ZYMT9|nr:unnamed protein product [Zymoseptoria tritici ST99CH_3D7]SMR53742.1 unnamed protein product [Zymoseptoria tritici ST99CH_1E4]SMR56060.1 unnamed protein product [Zymoseptoria tritici ST99CH_3D1]
MEESEATLSVPSGAHTGSQSRAPSVKRREETSDSEKAGRVWARGVDDPWHPCILTLDGGGIRGYSSLLILKALMHEIWGWEKYYDNEANVEFRTDSPTSYEEQDDGVASRGCLGHPERNGSFSEARGANSADSQAIPAATSNNNDTTDKPTCEADLLPCHYFDFMYGTSTGGLIAIILGRLRMSVSEGLLLYRKVGDDLFGKRRSRVPLMTKYYHEPLEKAVRDIVSSRCSAHPNCDGNDLHPWETNQNPFDVDQPRVCQTACLTATHDESLSEAHLLRSYPHFYTSTTENWITRYNEGSDPLQIWQVSRATTAAPFYFEMLKAVVDDVEMSFKDGGIRENNPSAAAISEFHSLYEGRANAPALLLSVGTGRPNQTHDGFAAPWPSTVGRIPLVSKFLEKRAVVQNLLIKYTEGEKQHKQTREHAKGEHTWYKRLNVSKGFEHMPLDHWEKGLWKDPDTGREKVVNGGASLTRMEKATEEELNREFNPEIDSYAPPRTMLRQAAQKLVLQRRAREAEGGSRWDVFVGRAAIGGQSTTNGHAG